MGDFLGVGNPGWLNGAAGELLWVAERYLLSFASGEATELYGAVGTLVVAAQTSYAVGMLPAYMIGHSDVVCWA